MGGGCIGPCLQGSGSNVAATTLAEWFEGAKELKCPELEKLFGISKFAAMSKDEQAMYLKELMDEIDRKSELRTAQNLGREEGRNEGREEGRAEGVAQTARSMKSKGLPVELISECTGLTPEQIEQL